MTKIRITVGNVVLDATLNGSDTAERITAALPLTASASVWGDEIYFAIPVDVSAAPDAKEIVAVGTLGYWPVGKAFCIFYGRTPVSTDEHPRAYSPVNVIGEITDDATRLRGISSGTSVSVTLA